MTVVLIDARFYGDALRRGRRSAHLSRKDLSKILKIPRDALVRIERGQILPDETLIRKIFVEACNMMWAKNYHKVNK